LNNELSPVQNNLCILTLVETTQDLRNAWLLVKSLRLFGGSLEHAPVWVFFQPDLQAGNLLSSLSGIEGIQLVPLDLDSATPGNDYPFASKVHVCAQAEGLAGTAVRSMIWFNPNCLVTNPPTLFDLAPAFDAAFRPVHHQNIGSLAQTPLDDFWLAVYRRVGLVEAPFTVESFVDSQKLRPYFNTHCFAINPALELLNTWQQCFQAMLEDVSFQAGPCRGPLQRIFLHQAILSALIAKSLDPGRIRILPPEYSYPLHMHTQIPLDRRPRKLNDLVCPVYESAFEYPATLNGLPVDDPVHSWLQAHGN
jgi:hypothetical protein